VAKHKQYLGGSQSVHDELERLRGLLVFVGQHIKQRAANMSWMTKSCRMCTGTKLRRENCRHDEIFAITAAAADAEAQHELAGVERMLGEEAAD